MTRILVVLLLIRTTASLASGTPARDQVSNSVAQLSGINKYDRRAAMESLGTSKDVRAVQPLVARLGNREDGAYAAKALAALGLPAIDPLIKSLSSKSALVRGNAALALGLLKNGRAAKPLLGMLNDPEPQVRVLAIEALSFSKDPAVTAKMLTVYNNPDEEHEVQGAACNTIVRIGDPKAIDKLIARLGDGGETYRVVAALAQLADPRVMRTLILAVDADGPIAARRAWAQIGVPMVAPLTTLLKDTDAGVRAGAAEALFAIIQQTKDSSALDPLVVTLEDADPKVRLAAVNALGKIGGDRVVDALIDALRDADAKVRSAAAFWLQYLRAPRSVEPLCAALTDLDAGVRQAVALALWWLEDPRSVDPLLRAIEDPDRSVRSNAYLALSAIDDPRVVRVMLDALSSPDPFLRRSGAGGLARVGGTEAVDPLIAALKDPDAEVQRCAAVSLGSIGDKRALEPMIELLRTSERNAKSEIAGAIGSLKDMRAVRPLLDIALADPENGIGIMATLAEMGDTSAVEPIIGLLDDRKLDEQTRGNILWVLGDFKDRRATPALLAALKENKGKFAQEVLDAVIEIRDPRAFDALADIVRNAKSFDRWNAAYALSLIDDPRVEPFLMPYAEKGDMEVIAGADQFFIKHGVERAIPALLDAANREYGGANLVEPLLQSGRPELVKAAQEWKSKHPGESPGEEGAVYAKWGEAKK